MANRARATRISLLALLVMTLSAFNLVACAFFDGTAAVTTCRHENMSLMLGSGEEMGMGPDSAGVDFGLIDFRLPPAAFVRLDHYDHFYI